MLTGSVSYLVAGVGSFLLGIAVTLLCFHAKELEDMKKEDEK